MHKNQYSKLRNCISRLDTYLALVIQSMYCAVFSHAAFNPTNQYSIKMFYLSKGTESSDSSSSSPNTEEYIKRFLIARMRTVFNTDSTCITSVLVTYILDIFDRE